MKMKYFILFFGIYLLFVNKSSAQYSGVALNLGYSYVGANAGYVGGEYSYGDWKGNRMNAGIGGYFGRFYPGFRFVPAAHIAYTHQSFFSGELSVSTHNINPSVGIGLLNVFKLKAGYSFPIGNTDFGMKGVSFGLNFFLGTKHFYDELKFM